MSGVALAPAQVIKEVRALFPVWLACLLTLGVAGFSGDPQLFVLALFTYGIGALALGSFSIGQEYSYRTLASLMAQPFDRRQLWLLKLAVLACMVGTLAIAAWLLVPEFPHSPRDVWNARPAILLVAADALFVAPWLTMVCRSVLAGVVFAVVLPGALMIAGDLIGLVMYGDTHVAQVDQFKAALVYWGMPVICAATAVAGWRLFMRLEAVDGRGSEVNLRWWASNHSGTAQVSSVRRQHPIWVLLKKEIHLQQMTFVVAGLFVLGRVVIALLARLVPESRMLDLGIEQATVLYLGLLAILIGSLSSAEERQLGTLDGQLCLPVSPLRQWIVKVTAAIGLALLLGVGLALVMDWITPVFQTVDARSLARPRRVADWLMVTYVILALTGTSVFVSSFSSSGVWAMVISLPVVGGLIVLLRILRSFAWTMGGMSVSVRSRHVLSALDGWILVVVGVGVALMLCMAFLNYRTIERRRSRVGWQFVILAALATTSVITFLAVLTQ